MDNQPYPQQDSDISPPGSPQIQKSEPKDSIPTEPTTSEQLSEVERQMTGFEKATLRWAKIAVLLSGLAALFVCAQWYEMHEGSSDTHALAEAAKTQSEKMSSVSDAADKIRQAAENMVIQDQQIADNAHKSLDASNKQSKAALDATIRNSRLDERPWLVASRFQLSAEPTENTEITVTIWITNTGKTPALDETNQSTLLLSTTVPQMTVFPEGKPTTGGNTIVPPGTTSMRFISSPLLTPPLWVSRYNDKVATLYMHARMRYKDVFHREHWTTICIYRLHGTPLDEFGNCEEGNGVDQEAENPN